MDRQGFDQIQSQLSTVLLKLNDNSGKVSLFKPNRFVFSGRLANQDPLTQEAALLPRRNRESVQLKAAARSRANADFPKVASADQHTGHGSALAGHEGGDQFAQVPGAVVPCRVCAQQSQVHQC